jgi:hypothetical protein
VVNLDFSPRVPETAEGKCRGERALATAVSR